MPAAALVFPGFREQVANEFEVGAGEIDLDTGQAFSPVEPPESWPIDQE
jgi:hypothetical protein